MPRVDLIAQQEPDGSFTVPIWAGPAGWITLNLFAVSAEQCAYEPGRLRVMRAMGFDPNDVFDPATARAN